MAGTAPNDLDLEALDRALQRLYRTRALIGAMPAAPATFRARAGGVLVRFVRRSLFWLFPQLDAFHGAVVEFAECQMALMEELRFHLVALDEEIAQARHDLPQLSDTPAPEEKLASSTGELWLQIARCQAGVESIRQAIERAPL
jgi:hypothetical protein